MYLFKMTQTWLKVSHGSCVLCILSKKCNDDSNVAKSYTISGRVMSLLGSMYFATHRVIVAQADGI